MNTIERIAPTPGQPETYIYAYDGYDGKLRLHTSPLIVYDGSDDMGILDEPWMYRYDGTNEWQDDGVK